jgi:NAD(P)-dependent dehydrogenase (short-subunit alcohol dehydrogenase family)
MGTGIGLLMMMPTGPGARLFNTSSIESAKLESGRSSLATSRIAVRGFASPLGPGHDDPEKSRRAQSAPAT